ncbi:hypothetical protein L204_103252 [Cryptococcus depauperatus]
MSATVFDSAQATAIPNSGSGYFFKTNEQAEDYVSHWETSELLRKLGFEYNATFKVFRCAKCQFKRAPFTYENNHCTKFENIVKHTTGRCHRVKHTEAESDILEQIKAIHPPHLDENPRIPMFSDRSLLPAVPGLAMYDGYYCPTCPYGTKGMVMMKNIGRYTIEQKIMRTRSLNANYNPSILMEKRRYTLLFPTRRRVPIPTYIHYQVLLQPKEQSPLLMAFSWDMVFHYQKDIQLLYSLVSTPRSHEPIYFKRTLYPVIREYFNNVNNNLAGYTDAYLLKRLCFEGERVTKDESKTLRSLKKEATLNNYATIFFRLVLFLIRTVQHRPAIYPLPLQEQQAEWIRRIDVMCQTDGDTEALSEYLHKLAYSLLESQGASFVRDPWRYALYHFLVLLCLQEDGAFERCHLISPKLARIQWVFRAVVWTEIKKTVGREELDEMEYEKQGPFGQILFVRDKVTAIAYSERLRRNARWEDARHHTLVIDDKHIHLPTMKNAIHNLLDCLHSELEEEILMGFDLKLFPIPGNQEKVYEGEKQCVRSEERFYVSGHVFLVTRYDKSQAITEKEKWVARMLPIELGNIMVLYLGWPRHPRDISMGSQWKKNSRERVFVYLFNTLALELEHSFYPQVWRHAIAAITEEFNVILLDDDQEEKTQEDDENELVNFSHEQSGHSAAMARAFYARMDEQASKTTSDIFLSFGQCSQKYQRIWGIEDPPVGQGKMNEEDEEWEKHVQRLKVNEARSNNEEFLGLHLKIDQLEKTVEDVKMLLTERQSDRLKNSALDRIRGRSRADGEGDGELNEGMNEGMDEELALAYSKVERPRIASPESQSADGPEQIQDVKEALFVVFGEQARWKNRFQEKAARMISTTKENCFIVGPTTVGKTLTWALPALLESNGFTVVIVPLVALKEEYLAKLKTYSIAVSEWTGPIMQGPQRAIVLVSVEEAGTFEFVRWLGLYKDRCKRIVMEEAHIILTSASYRWSMHRLKLLAGLEIPKVLVSATIPPHLVETMLKQLWLEEAMVLRTATTMRNFM